MGIKKITISHKRNKCIGCGACVTAASKYWKMNNEDGLADLVGGKINKNGVVSAEIDEIDYEVNKKAADACPVNIIEIN